MQGLDRANLNRRTWTGRKSSLNDAMLDACGVQLSRSLLGQLAPMPDENDVLAALDRVSDLRCGDDGLAGAGWRHQA
jgi:hypothetical protein